MPFYDHFHSGEVSDITPMGRATVHWRNRYFLRLIRQFVGKDPISLLEIGPGLGFFAEQCRQDRLDYTALEANGKMAADLAARGFQVYNRFVPPVDVEGRFDAIFMSHVFEHMKDRDQAEALVESCKEHLSPRGLVVIVSPDVLTVKEDFFQDYTHNYPTCLPRLRGLFVDHDLEILHEDLLAIFVRGAWLTRFTAFLVRLLYGMGFFSLFFGRRAYKAKLSMLPECIIVGQLSSPSTSQAP